MSATGSGLSLAATGAGSALERLADVLREEGGLVGSIVVDAPAVAPGSDGIAHLAASGPRTLTRAGDYELVVEAIYEGYLLHYGAGRVVVSDDVDLRLLAGDRLYALGLTRLVELHDIEAVRELADVISLTALAHVAAQPDLAETIWRAGARAVGWGTSPEHERAKEHVRAGSEDAGTLLLACVV